MSNKVVEFPNGNKPNSRPKLVPMPGTEGAMSPKELLQHFMEIANKDEIVFLGVHAVRRDGLLVQAATGMMMPETISPDYVAPGSEPS